MAPTADGLKKVWLVGGEFQRALDEVSVGQADSSLAEADTEWRCFADVAEVKAALEEMPLRDYTILIKGSNGTKLYQLPEML